MKRKINCETARNFYVLMALEKLGHFPNRTTEKEAWFLSPFRSETQASFKVSLTRNRWYDHGMGIGGNVIDLVSRILRCTVKEALEFLNNEISHFSFQQQPIIQQRTAGITITKVQEIQHPALIHYLQTRSIPLAIAKLYCKEVWYTYKTKTYFAIGLQNILGGWELRNKIFKNSSSPKTYTYIKQGHSQLIIMEGMFDLMSLAVLNNAQLHTSDILILNSTAFIKDVEQYTTNYEIVQLYLDNDAAGQNISHYLTKKFKHIKDQSASYKHYKDLNELLRNER
ncbi:toprim domain-containing protein [Tamlana sp. 2201CG12-4]|uniref:toprim domain-containing protein n=1 Tax=Tamlana sp. 2201CG12-4 TaxID=3112582 RepID=UPI002DBC65BB|nr:toprim domain-containing protein [Tamlana sp. 2201CG12-4]MEC3908745.1 toprim domain-containing protein [Tamlana sp. 2201CG12-4]